MLDAFQSGFLHRMRFAFFGLKISKPTIFIVFGPARGIIAAVTTAAAELVRAATNISAGVAHAGPL